ncbi:hypothetical protein OHT57_01040 [Streptomyces sp. NBC_00285]|uniref:hypothetical protein n=1 Tax=Streptomyces sp. NBC_00285 TaxID=2975700 RepID=UPI002E2BDAEC|nr:hypothetical protein [Streptomyces sp. NBC_00285]
MTFLGEPDHFTPNTCGLGINGNDWNAIASSGAMSAFCGIMAGFVLAGLVTVIGQKNADGGDGHASRGLKLFLPCFVGLAASSYLYALTSGELVCTRAITEQLFSGAILAADALIVIVALAWLLPAYDRNKHGEVRFFRGLILFGAQFSMLMVIVSADAFNNSVLKRHVDGWATWSERIVGGLFMIVIVFVWKKRLPPAPPMPGPMPRGHTVDGWPPYWRDEILLNGRVQVAARTAVAVGGLLAVAGGLVVGRSWEHWASMQPWLAYTFSGVTLVLPALAITTAVRAAPRV